MKRFKSLLLAFVTVGLMAPPSLVWAKTHHKTAAQSHTSSAGHKPSAAKSKSAAKSTAKGSSKSKSSRSKAASAEGSSQKCTVVKTRKGRHVRTRKTCASEEKAIQSPIQNTDLNAPPVPKEEGKPVEIKARTVPDRAYAVDGETFFYQGRKFKISGLSVGDNSEMAKQRLQKALDGGNVSVEAAGADDAAGVTTAVVRVGGRNIVDLIPKP